MENKNIEWPGWQTVRRIGKGSFGAVYEIERDMFGEKEKAALKVITIPQNEEDIKELQSDGYDNESITETFQGYLQSIVAEYSLMRKMNGSANVVNCDDVRYVQHDDGIGWDIFIKMELLTPLTEALPGQIPENTVARIGSDICKALVLCKKYDIVHRDIKPQNIFVSPNGDYKLGDFGVAKTVEKTTGGTKIGTYKYMAPEVYNNQPYGAAADIYSLGLVLYWLLNERRMPFLPLPPVKLKAGMDEEAKQRRLSGEPIPVPKNGSAELKRIVMKACAFDPKERYHTADEMLADLNTLQGIKTEPVIIPDEPNVGKDNSEVADEADETEATVGGFGTDTYVPNPDSGTHQGNAGTKGGLDDATEGVFYANTSAKSPMFSRNAERSTRKKLLAIIAACVTVCLVFGITRFVRKGNQPSSVNAGAKNEQTQQEALASTSVDLPALEYVYKALATNHLANTSIEVGYNDSNEISAIRFVENNIASDYIDIIFNPYGGVAQITHLNSELETIVFYDFFYQGGKLKGIGATATDGTSERINTSADEMRTIRKENNIETDAMVSMNGILAINFQHASTTAGVFLSFSSDGKISYPSMAQLEYSTDYFVAHANFVCNDLKTPSYQMFSYSNTDGLHCGATYVNEVIEEVSIYDDDGNEIADPQDYLGGVCAITNTVSDLEVGWNISLPNILTDYLEYLDSIR